MLKMESKIEAGGLTLSFEPGDDPWKLKDVSGKLNESFHTFQQLRDRIVHYGGFGYMVAILALHNLVDKVAEWAMQNRISPSDKSRYTGPMVQWCPHCDRRITPATKDDAERAKFKEHGIDYKKG